MNRRYFLKSSAGIALGLTAAGVSPVHASADGFPTHINAQSHGLKPNISTDQSQILQTAIHQAAIQKLPLFIPAGTYIVNDINLLEKTHLIGANKQTHLIQTSNAPIINANNANDIIIENITFEGNLTSYTDSQILSLNTLKNIKIKNCRIFNGNGNGIKLSNSTAQITNNEIYNINRAALFSINGKNHKITNNSIHNCANNGILIWQKTQSEDSSIITNNHIYNIKSIAGGTGQNGNGINIFKANNVIISNNRFDNCTYSAVRINSGNNCQILNNNCTNIGEVALYAEFAFNGVIINNNLVDRAGSGIIMTNLNQNGHLAICNGNLVRNLVLRPVKIGDDDARGMGIGAEADALIEGNVIENAINFGIASGYGKYQRNVSILNNMIKDSGTAITVSVAANAGKVTISNNSINNSKTAAIIGYEWQNPSTNELINDNQKFDEGTYKNLNISNNVLI